MDISLQSFKRWTWRGGFGILDQAVFSGMNFLTSLLLARWLSYEDFGAFAMALAVFSFIMQIYTSFSLEPMSVLGPSRYQGRISSYLLSQVKFLFIISAPVSLLLILSVVLDKLFDNLPFAGSVFIALALGLPFLLFPILMRRVFYVLSKPRLAFLGSFIYAATILMLFYLTERMGVLNSTASLINLSVASFLSGLTLLLFLRREFKTFERIDLRKVMLESWSFGKWLLLSGILIALATQSQIYLTGVLSSVSDAGAVRILQTYIQPMMLTSTAFSTLATPAIAANFASGAYQAMRKKVYNFTLVLGGVSLLYAFFLVMFGAPLNRFLFDEKYQYLTEQISVWSLVPVLLSFFWGGAIALQASHRPQAMLIIAVFWMVFSVIPGIILIPGMGVWGATVSIVLGLFAALTCTWFLYWRWIHLVYIPIKQAG